MIRLIVQVGDRKLFEGSNGHLDTRYRVFEVENEAFEELIKADGSLTLIGIEVTEGCLAAPLPTIAPAPVLAPAPIALEAAPAPTPALQLAEAVAQVPGLPPPGPVTLLDLKARMARKRWGVANWRKLFGLRPKSGKVKPLPLPG